MKTLITNYVFDGSAKTIVFSDYSSIALGSVLLITNVTSNVIIYNFADPTLGGTVTGNVLTLAYDTSAMADTDKLMVYYDDPKYVQETTLTTILRSLLTGIRFPGWLDRALNALRVTITSGTVTTVSTVTTVGNQTNIDSYPGRMLVIGQNRSAWAQTVRNKIT